MKRQCILSREDVRGNISQITDDASSSLKGETIRARVHLFVYNSHITST